MAIIEIKDVTKCYDTGSSRVWALQGFSLSIQPGESIIFSGKSGCGKTTLLNLVGGLDKPTSGEVWVGQRNIGVLSEKERALYRRREVGTIFQSFNLIPMLSVEENIALPHWLEGISTEQTRNRVEILLDQLDLTPRRNHRPYELSGGEQQRVAVARALVLEPKVLLADEPTGNLDTQTGESVFDLLQELNEVRGVTLIVVTHNLELASRMSRQIHLVDGKTVKSG